MKKVRSSPIESRAAFFNRVRAAPSSAARNTALTVKEELSGGAINRLFKGRCYLSHVRRAAREGLGMAVDLSMQAFKAAECRAAARAWARYEPELARHADEFRFRERGYGPRLRPSSNPGSRIRRMKTRRTPASACAA